MLRLLLLTSLFLMVGARVGGVWYTCGKGFQSFRRNATRRNVCLGVVTASNDSQTPEEICDEQMPRADFALPENKAEAEWLWNQTHVGDAILVNGFFKVQCNTTKVNGKIEGLCVYDDDNEKKVITTSGWHTDTEFVKDQLVPHPELELYSVPETSSSKSYEVFCPLYLKKQTRWVDVKYCGTKKEIRENVGKNGRKSVVCAQEPVIVMA